MDYDIDHIASLISDDPAVVYRDPMDMMKNEAKELVFRLDRMIKEGATLERWAETAKKFYDLANECPKKTLAESHIDDLGFYDIMEAIVNDKDIHPGLLSQGLVGLGILSEMPYKLGKRGMSPAQGKAARARLAQKGYKSQADALPVLPAAPPAAPKDAKSAARARLAKKGFQSQALRPEPGTAAMAKRTLAKKSQARAKSGAPAQGGEFASPELKKRALHLQRVSSPTGFAQTARDKVARKLGMPPNAVGVRKNPKTGMVSLVINLKSPAGEEGSQTARAGTGEPGTGATFQPDAGEARTAGPYGTGATFQPESKRRKLEMLSEARLQRIAKRRRSS